MENLTDLLAFLGPEVEDVDEESFLLFAQDIPSANLGFVDSRATDVDVTIHGQDYTIHQSPTLLSSSRAGGTTGAVLWKITPLIAEWLSASQSNPLWNHSLLKPSSTVVELGCGISALIALTLAPQVRHYIATDQEYVHRLFRQNLEANVSSAQSRSQGKSKSSKKRGGVSEMKGKGKGKADSGAEARAHPNITFTSLDWELDVPGTLRDSVEIEPESEVVDDGGEEEEDKGFDLVVSCDCIYNEALVEPYVRTCADICRLRPVYKPDGAGTGTRRPPTVCIIAQQQRSPDVFEAWLQETMSVFRVWRVSDEMLGGKLKLGSGYLVHLLLLREDAV